MGCAWPSASTVTKLQVIEGDRGREVRGVAVNIGVTCTTPAGTALSQPVVTLVTWLSSSITWCRVSKSRIAFGGCRHHGGDDWAAGGNGDDHRTRDALRALRYQLPAGVLVTIDCTASTDARGRARSARGR